MRPVILEGDKTSHGGTVLEGAPTTLVYGRRLARVGDKVSCPLPGHQGCVIVSGDETTLEEGQPIARDGDKVSCGATLIASEQDTGML